MQKMKTINSETLLNRQLKNKQFRKEYNALEEEFEIAKEVIKLRQNAKLTQKELAEKAGTSQPAIARLESGEYKNLTLSFLRRIGEVLGVVPEVHFRKLNKIN
jgi:DNA-binding Xre family transcriptional regulator